MADKKPGYQYNIFDQISDNDKQQKFQEALAKLEQEYAKKIASKKRDIDDLRASDPYDRDAETRKEIREEEMELRELEERHDKEIAALRDQQKLKFR